MPSLMSWLRGVFDHSDIHAPLPTAVRSASLPRYPAQLARILGQLLNVLPLLIVLVCCTAIISNTKKVASHYVCPNHTGSMYKMALDVRHGMVLYRDTYSQYGPLPTWFHALALLIFGNHVVVITMATAPFLAALIWLLYRLWSRLMPTWIAMLGILFLFPTLSYAGLPWPNYFQTFFTLLSCVALLRGLDSNRCFLIFLAGVSIGGAALSRQQGILTLPCFLAFLGLLPVCAGVPWRRALLASFTLGLGTLAVLLPFFFWLYVTGAYSHWYLQTVKIVQVAYNEYHGSAFASLTQTVTGMVRNTQFHVNDPAHLLYDGAPRVWGFVAATALLFVIQPIAIRCSGQTVSRDHIIAALLGWASLAGWTQAYPLADDWRFALGLAPAVGLLVYLFWLALFRNIRVILAVVPIGLVLFYFLPLPAWQPWLDRQPQLLHRYCLQFPRVGWKTVTGTPILAGVELPAEQADFFSELASTLSGYEHLYPHTPFVTTGVEPLLAGLVENTENFHPMLFSWWSQLGTMANGGENMTINMILYPDYLQRREAYIHARQPLIMNYGEHREGYVPIFAHAGMPPVCFATMWCPSPIITIQAPVERARRFFEATGQTPPPQRLRAVSARVDLQTTSDPEHAPTALIDCATATFWLVQDDHPGEHAVTIDLGRLTRVGKLELHGRPGFHHLFPSRFVLEASRDGEHWQELVSTNDYRAVEGKPFELHPSQLEARYLRLRAYSSRHQDGPYFIQLAELCCFSP